MFLGHYAVGLAAKRMAPGTSLGVLIAAVQLPDLLWPIFLLLGWEQVGIDPGNTAFTPVEFIHYPISHSLLNVVGWGVFAALVFHVLRRRARDAMLVAVLVVSHWILDFVTHRPDLPLYPGGPLTGLGLWNHVVATIIVEFAMLVVGLWLYVRATHARDWIGRYVFWLMIALLVLIYVGGIGSTPPADAKRIAWLAMIGWLIPLWAAWADAHRRASAEPPVARLRSADP